MKNDRPVKGSIPIGLAHLKSASKKASSIALDIETTGFELFTSKITWVSWCTGVDCYGVIPVGHRNLGPHKNDNEADVKEFIKNLHRQESKKIIWHNGAFDLSMLVSKEWLDLDDLGSNIIDTMLASHVLNPTKSREGLGHGLKSLFDELIREQGEQAQPSFEEVTKGVRYQDIDFDDAACYAAFDALSTFRIWEKFNAEISSDKKLEHYFNKIAMPHLNTTVEIITTGLRLANDSEIASRKLKTRDMYEEEKDTALNILYSLVGKSFNFESPIELRGVLFFNKDREKQIRPQGKSDSGDKDAVDREALLKMFHSERNEDKKLVVALVLYIRELGEALKKHDEMYYSINEKSNRIHSSLRQTTTSGRYSSSKPNILSMSTSSNIKNHIIPDEGKSFVVADFSQVDLRSIANESGQEGDSEYLNKVNDGFDLHLMTLGIVDNRVKPDWKAIVKSPKTKKPIGVEVGKSKLDKSVSVQNLKSLLKKRSDIAKPINFGISYGLGPTKLQANLEYTDNQKEQIVAICSEAITDLDRLKQDLASEEIDNLFESHSVEDVRKYLSEFSKKYKEIGEFQNKVVADLVESGITWNCFGRKCVAEIYHILLDKKNKVFFDVLSKDNNWYRVYLKISSITKSHIRGLVTQVFDLEVTKPKGFKSKQNDLIKTKRQCLFSLNDSQLSELESTFSKISTGYVPSKVDKTIKNILAEASEEKDKFAEGSFFNEFKISYIDCKFNQRSNLDDEDKVVSHPYFSFSHNNIKFIGYESGLNFKKEIELTYVGFDKLRRNLISSRVSSTSMDICKIAMSEFRKKVKQRWPLPSERPRIVNCIHDEIAVECRTVAVKEVQEILLSCMKDKQLLKGLAINGKVLVDLDAEAGFGDSYQKAKP